ncbi:MAG: DAK2 domain-containing protein, partial [Burkholderiales bacterium]
MEDQLSVEIFYGMILTGAKQVIVNEGELNRLNVFPVADRDTGTNLASMMRYIVDNLSLTHEPQELLHQLSQHGLVGCSGNSGLIFSQFFYGLTQHKLASKTFVKLQEFASMIMAGYKSAYASVSNPKPGTILTVMERWASSYRELVNNTKSPLIDSFYHSVEKAKEALRDTINQLEVLRQNHVVDAGAQGFIHFIEGMLVFLKADSNLRRQLLEERHLAGPRLEINHEFEELAEIPNCRYCFEMVLRTAKDSSVLEHQREYLEQLGDSMVIGRAPQMEKLHIHTDKPELITQHLAQFGDILYQKIDDMVMQYNISNNTQSPIALAIDSTADV